MNTLRILALLYGVVPVMMNKPVNKKAFMDYSLDLLEKDGYLAKGDTVVFVNRYPFERIGLTNELTVHML
jgi:pyruvate kinase